MIVLFRLSAILFRMRDEIKPGTSTVERDETSPAAERKFSLRQRIILWIVPRLAQALLTLFGCTLRFEYSWEDERDADASLRFPPAGTIGLFWHRCLLLAAYGYRNCNATVMISSSFDGELIARTIHRMGFRTMRGSSTRGAVRALLGMHDAARGAFTAFTADGPKGPRYIAKPGPVLLARNTGNPICCFYLAPRGAWEINSWDRLLIPKPFTRVHVRWSKRIDVPGDASSAQMKAMHEELQAALERARLEAERRVSGRR